MADTEKKERVEQLYSLIVSLDNAQDCRALFEDLCTVKELENMAVVGSKAAAGRQYL